MGNVQSIDFNDYIHFLKLEESEAYVLLREESFSGTGPGGQHRNRVKTGIRLIHPPWGAQGECSQYREGKRNRREALENLRLNLDQNCVFPFENFQQEWATLPKQRINTHNKLYPLWRACVKALWRDAQFETQGLKVQSHWSNSAIIKQCARDSQMWLWLNQERQKRQLHPLKVP